MKTIPNFPFPEPDLAPTGKALDVEARKPRQMFNPANGSEWWCLNKYDGVRSLSGYWAVNDYLAQTSRKDNIQDGYNTEYPRECLQEVYRYLRDAGVWKQVGEGIGPVIDGEMYDDRVTADPDYFDTLSGMVRKSSGTSPGFEGIYYLIFDCYWPDDPELVYQDRMTRLIADMQYALGLLEPTWPNTRKQKLRFCSIPTSGEPYFLYNDPALAPAYSTNPDTLDLGTSLESFVPRDHAAINILNPDYWKILDIASPSFTDTAELMVYYLESAESLGLEGIMVRSNHRGYIGGRAGTNLYKLKSFEDDEFEIIGYNGVMSEAGILLNRPVWKCITKSGEEFLASAPGTHVSQEQQWEDRDKIVGKMLTVKYQNLSARGVPRFPKGVAIRDYE
tara:strand:- start:222 stop:1394 length:1173 start_codon:yes stop_codon:yes gene_type:complete